MSCFGGKLKEYPTISVDCFTKENLESLAFFLSHCHKDHMDGLDSTAFANVMKSSSNKMIYCSDTTRNLLLCNQAYSHLEDYLVGIPIDQPYLVTLYNTETNKREVITVTLLSAGHCVGSVMFLFEGSNGNVLYTGDFRLAKGDAQRISLLHNNGGVKDVKSIYIDTTFCLPKMMSIPSRKATRDAIIQIIDRWISRGSTYMVNLLCKGMYGYEYILKEIAQHYKTKIHVSKERLALYQYLTDMPQYFTTDPGSTVIHSCRWHKSTKDVKSSLPCGFIPPNGLTPNIIKIKPSTMWFARRSDPLPADNSTYCRDSKTWRVVHSMHASMEEIIDLVSYIKPYHVFPNVEPAGLYTVDDAWEWLKQYTRVDECDSCGREDSGERNFKVMAAKFKFATGSASENTSKINTIKRSSPSHQVAMSYKELGLEEDVSLAPLPSGSDKVRNSNDADRAEKRDFANENTINPQQNDGPNNMGLLQSDIAKNSGSIPGHTEKLLDNTPEKQTLTKEETTSDVTTSSFQDDTIHDISFNCNSEFNSGGKTSLLSSSQGPNKNSLPGTPEKPSLSIENPPDSFQEDVCQVSCRSGTDLVLKQKSGSCPSKKPVLTSSSSSADLRKSTNGASRENVCGKTFAKPTTGNSTEAPKTAVHSTTSQIPNITYPSQDIVYSKSNVKTAGNTEDSRITRLLASACNADCPTSRISSASLKCGLVGSTVSTSSNSSAAAVHSTAVNQTSNASGIRCSISNYNYSANDTNSPVDRSTNSVYSGISDEILANACILNDSDASNSASIAFDIPASPGVFVPTQDELAEFYKQLENGDFQA